MINCQSKLCQLAYGKKRNVFSLKDCEGRVCEHLRIFRDYGLEDIPTISPLPVENTDVGDMTESDDDEDLAMPHQMPYNTVYIYSV